MAFVEQEQLWHGVMKAKYGEQWGDWSTVIMNRPRGCSSWKGIRAGWNGFSDFVSIRVGNGKRIQSSFGIMHGMEISLYTYCL